MTETATNASPDWAPSAPLAETVGELAVVLAQSQYPSGDRAALKRWQPGQPLPLAYYRLWFHHLRREAPGPEWMPVIWALAFGGAEFHQPKRALGEALAEAGFSSARLERMLSAPEDLRLEMFQTAVRFLSAKGGGCDVRALAAFLLTQDPDRRERLHERIARDYYRSESQLQK